MFVKYEVLVYRQTKSEANLNLNQLIVTYKLYMQYMGKYFYCYENLNDLVKFAFCVEENLHKPFKGEAIFLDCV